MANVEGLADQIPFVLVRGEHEDEWSVRLEQPAEPGAELITKGYRDRSGDVPIGEGLDGPNVHYGPTGQVVSSNLRQAGEVSSERLWPISVD